MLRQIAVILVVITSMQAATYGDWLRFRGPNGSGVSKDTVPTEWSPSKNLKWKVPLPGLGLSSPIVVGDRVFVTCYSGYGLSREDPGDQEDLRRHLVCVNAADGSVLWTKEFKPFLPEDPFTGIGVTQHGYASHTPVSDGERVYAFFGKSGVYAFDLEGNQLWQKSVGTESGAHGWGTSSSSLLHKDHLIVPATAESQAMVAFNKLTGEEVWRQEASGFDSVWGSPVLARVDDERTDLVISVPGEIWALNPETGKMQWYCQTFDSNMMCSSAIADDGIVYAIEQGRGGGGGIAVKVGGSKDVTDSHVVWQGSQSSRFDTPVLFNGRIYTVGNNLAQCYDAKTGEEISKLRLKAPGRTADAQEPPAERSGGGRRGGFGNQDYSSPVVAGDKIYFQSRKGDCFVIGTGDNFEQLAVNRVTNDSEDFSAAPAISNGALFIRSDGHLYCVAE